MTNPWDDPMDDDVAARAREAAVGFEAVMVSIRKDKNGVNLVLAVSPIDLPPDIMMAPIGARYQIAAVRLDDQDMPVASTEKTEGERAVASAGMLCQDDTFQQWLVENNKAESADEESAKQAVYKECGIASRKELRTDRRARAAWRGLVDRYEEYIRRG